MKNLLFALNADPLWEIQLAFREGWRIKHGRDLVIAAVAELSIPCGYSMSTRPSGDINRRSALTARTGTSIWKVNAYNDVRLTAMSRKIGADQQV
jgi:hypothetical protein